MFVLQIYGKINNIHYLGNHAGLLNIKCECMNLTEIYEVLDCIYIDNCTSADHNDNAWQIPTNQYTIFNRGTDYTTFSTSDASVTTIIYLLGLSSECIVEFEHYQVDGTYGNGMFNLYNSSNISISNGWASYQNMGYGASTSPVGSWVKLQIKIHNGEMTVTNLDDSSKTVTKTITDTPVKIRFSSSSNSVSERRFRNIRIYQS